MSSPLVKIQNLQRQLVSTMTEMQKVLRELETEYGTGVVRPSVRIIQDTVCEHYRLPATVMASRLRTDAVAQARSIAMVLCLELTKMGSQEIGRQFGKHHSTVIYAQKRITQLMETEINFKNEVEMLRHTARTRLNHRELPLWQKAL
jgi:chromosomal replication initiator protein